ncbi:MAG: type IV pilus modification PilV family protein [Candidatus Rifleibacteriota bacterium]
MKKRKRSLSLALPGRSALSKNVLLTRRSTTCGFSLLEIMIALTILTMGILPVTNLMSQSRTAINRSENEMKAVIMSSSLMDAFFRLENDKFVRLPSAALDENQLKNYGIFIEPDEVIKLEAQVKAVNLPRYPDDRFNNPFGRVFEITVTATSKQRNSRFYNQPITLIKDFRQVSLP